MPNTTLNSKGECEINGGCIEFPPDEVNKCHQSCLTCKNTRANGCLSCRKEKWLINGRCKPK